MEKEREPDWAKIKAEYVTSKITQKELAQKHGVSLRALRDRSANGKWSEKRREYEEKKAEKLADKLNEAAVRRTARDIESVCRLARKMIDKVNRAINQVDKVAYVSFDDKDVTVTSEPDEEGGGRTRTVMTRKMKLSKAEGGKASAKELAELSKTLLNLKQVLTVDDGGGEDTGGGVIEIAPMTEPEPPADESGSETA